MTQPTLIDSHAHIYYTDFADDFDGMLHRAADAGVAAILVVGTDLESSRQCVALAEKYPQLYASVGIHPHDAGGVGESDFSAIRDLALSSRKVVAIGEIGLDFYRDRSPRNEQERVFRRFLLMARELDLPVIIHDRDAHQQVLECLREDGGGGAEYCIVFPETVTWQPKPFPWDIIFPFPGL